MKVRVNYDNLPDEWKALDQWVCFDIEGDRKVPYIAGSSKKARSNDPSTFRSYEEALNDIKEGHRQHLGFVLKEENGYVFLDLDEPTTEEEKGLTKLIMQSFPSFTERSISGKGAHIFVKGKLNGRGLHTSHLGVFAHARAILVTGHIIKGRNKIQRANKKYLESLQNKVRTSDGQGYDFDLEETEWDAQPWAVNRLASIIYGDKFHALIDGRWQGLGYPSQSEADHALINMYCDISDSNSLVRYLFAESGLYREHKARRDIDTGEYSVKGYLDYTIKRNRSRQEKRDRVRVRVKEDVERQVEKSKAKKTPKKKSSHTRISRDRLHSASDSTIMEAEDNESFDYPTDQIMALPSEFQRDLAMFLYRNSYRPNQEVAILGSLVAMIMICQRAYLTPTGTGLNINLWLLAGTGWGKDSFTKAIDLIVGEMHQEQPRLGDSHVGKFASGEAIETVISQQPRFMSRVSEAGAFWRKLLSPHRPPYIDVLVESILNLFMTTNPKAYWRSRKKAKKDEEIVDSIFRPAGSFYGESTPEDLLGDLDLSSISTGLLQRQIFYHIDEAEYVRANQTTVDMSPSLKSRISELVSTADNLDLTEETIRVRSTERAALLLEDYSEGHSEYAFRKSKNELRANLMNRSGIKAYRLASLLAIGDSPHDPVIKERHALYAIEFIKRCDEFILDKFQSGDIGRGQLKQDSDMMKIIMKVVSTDERTRRRSYKMNELVAADQSIIPYSYLRNKAKSRASFAQDKLGAITAIDRCIDSLCKAGTLVRLTRIECEEGYESNAGLLRFTAQ